MPSFAGPGACTQAHWSVASTCGGVPFATVSSRFALAAPREPRSAVVGGRRSWVVSLRLSGAHGSTPASPSLRPLIPLPSWSFSASLILRRLISSGCDTCVRFGYLLPPLCRPASQPRWSASMTMHPMCSATPSGAPSWMRTSGAIPSGSTTRRSTSLHGSEPSRTSHTLPLTSFVTSPPCVSSGREFCAPVCMGSVRNARLLATVMLAVRGRFFSAKMQSVVVPSGGSAASAVQARPVLVLPASVGG